MIICSIEFYRCKERLQSRFAFCSLCGLLARTVFPYTRGLHTGEGCDGPKPPPAKLWGPRRWRWKNEHMRHPKTYQSMSWNSRFINHLLIQSNSFIHIYPVLEGFGWMWLLIPAIQDWTTISCMLTRLPNPDFASLAFEKGRAVVADPVKKLYVMLL